MDGEKLREGVYLRESSWGHRLVFPIKREDGTINWFNLVTGGNWWNVLIITFIVLIIIGTTFAYKRDVKECTRIANFAVNNPCEWCDVVNSVSILMPEELADINWSKFSDAKVDTEVMENGT